MSDVFHKNYGSQTDEQKSLVTMIKEKAEELLYLLGHKKSLLDPYSLDYNSVAPREYELAKTKLEECVMWAVKGIYK
jgi:hypothetical protein